MSISPIIQSETVIIGYDHKYMTVLADRRFILVHLRTESIAREQVKLGVVTQGFPSIIIITIISSSII
jgi:hypothetical protein